MGAIERRPAAGRILLPVAMVEDHLGRALDEKHLAIGRPVQGRHELVFGFEGDGVDARISGLLLLPLDAQFGGERIERALGRIALHLP